MAQQAEQPRIDAGIVERIRAGDAAAFETVFHQYYEPLCHFAERLVGNPSVAEDLVQDVFLKLWSQQRAWLIRESLRSYLYTATRNRILDHMKRATVEHRAVDDRVSSDLHWTMGQSGPGPQEAAEVEQFEAALRNAIDALPEHYRSVTELRLRYQLTYAETARVLGVPVKTAETRGLRALSILRQQLDRFLG